MFRTTLILTLSILISLALFTSCTPQRKGGNAGEYSDVYFSPHEGPVAFDKIYDMIAKARKDVKITIYSWSADGLLDATSEAIENGAKVSVVIHPPLYEKEYVQDKVLMMEKKGVNFRIGVLSMHEKFVIVDNKFLMNTSANFSKGARKRYSEAFIFHERPSEKEHPISSLFDDFNYEFKILWNSSEDIKTHGEEDSASIPFTGPKKENLPTIKNPYLLSSSMNWLIQEKKKDGNIVLGRQANEKGHWTWQVKNKLVDAIKKAKKSIHVGINHFNLKEVSDALVEAAKRGVDVKLTVDNQEYKKDANSKEKTPLFVQDWLKIPGNEKKAPPVRVKYYSHKPFPWYWRLNHHKFFLIDYDETGKGTTLFAGSYNLSRTAELYQFDNFVIYGGEIFKGIHNKFYTEFQRLWDLNRHRKEKSLKVFFIPNEGAYPLHAQRAVSLTWNEVKSLREKVEKNAPGMFTQIAEHYNCTHYNPTTKKYLYEDYKTLNLGPCQPEEKKENKFFQKQLEKHKKQKELRKKQKEMEKKQKEQSR